jgi:hypothetical protein
MHSSLTSTILDDVATLKALATLFSLPACTFHAALEGSDEPLLAFVLGFLLSLNGVGIPLTPTITASETDLKFSLKQGLTLAGSLIGATFQLPRISLKAWLRDVSAGGTGDDVGSGTDSGDGAAVAGTTKGEQFMATDITWRETGFLKYTLSFTSSVGDLARSAMWQKVDQYDDFFDRMPPGTVLPLFDGIQPV